MIDENPVTSHQIINNEATVFKLQEMRTSLRRYEILLKKENLQQDLINQVACTLSSVKEYIKSSNDCKQKAELLQNKHSYQETCHKERSILFVISDVQRIIAELINNFSVDLEALTDAELLQLKSDLSSKCELVNKAAQKYELILQTPFTKAEMLIDVKHIGDQYENLIQLKTDFTAKLHSLLQSRTSTNITSSLLQSSTYDWRSFLDPVTTLTTTHLNLISTSFTKDQHQNTYFLTC